MAGCAAGGQFDLRLQDLRLRTGFWRWGDGEMGRLGERDGWGTLLKFQQNCAQAPFRACPVFIAGDGRVCGWVGGVQSSRFKALNSNKTARRLPLELVPYSLREMAGCAAGGVSLT